MRIPYLETSVCLDSCGLWVLGRRLLQQSYQEISDAVPVGRGPPSTSTCSGRPASTRPWTSKRSGALVPAGGSPPTRIPPCQDETRPATPPYRHRLGRGLPARTSLRDIVRSSVDTICYVVSSTSSGPYYRGLQDLLALGRPELQLHQVHAPQDAAEVPLPPLALGTATGSAHLGIEPPGPADPGFDTGRADFMAGVIGDTVRDDVKLRRRSVQVRRDRLSSTSA